MSAATSTRWQPSPTSCWQARRRSLPPRQWTGLSTEGERAMLRGLAEAPDARPASAGQFAAGLRSAVEVGLGAPETRALAGTDRGRGGSAPFGRPRRLEDGNAVAAGGADVPSHPADLAAHRVAPA